MLRLQVLLALAMGRALTTTPAASDFEIGVEVKSGDRLVRTDRTEQTPSAEKPTPRRVIEQAPNERLSVSWHAENTSKAKPFEDVLVHFFVVRENEIGQAEIPKLDKTVIYEGALTMDFNPGECADWQFALKIREAGNYLLRVETIGMLDPYGHEYYSAIDLAIK